MLKQGCFVFLAVLACLSFPGEASAASKVSRSEIASCFAGSFDMIAQSEIVNGNPSHHRARVTTTHSRKVSGVWRKIDSKSKPWGLNVVIEHSHKAPTTMGLPDGRKLRVVSSHIFQRCGDGFWNEWGETTTLQIGCGEDLG